MAAKPLAKDRHGDYWWVDSRRLKEQEAFNRREDYGDIIAFAKEIRAQGIENLEPLECFKQGEDYMIIKGYRRNKALKILEKDGEIIMVRIMLAPKGYSKEMRILDQITGNDGKHFTPWEQAKVLRDLRGLGWSEQTLVERSGKTLFYIRRLLSLADAPQQLINLVREGRVKGTFAMDMIAEGRVEELLQKAEENNLPAPATEMELFPAPPPPPKPEKITRSDLKPNSWKAFRKWSKGVDENNLPKKKIETFKFLKQIEEGNLKEDDFIEFFK